MIRYRISSYSFRGNYSFLNLEKQRSQYINMRKLFKGGKYSRAETIWGNTVCFKYPTVWCYLLANMVYLLHISFKPLNFCCRYINEWQFQIVALQAISSRDQNMYLLVFQVANNLLLSNSDNCTHTIITRFWFQTDLDYKPWIL